MSKIYKRLAKHLAILVFSLASWPLVFAQNLAIKENSPQQHVVVKGDTLWDIANMFLNDPTRWREIWSVNPNIANPHLIYPGDRIYLDTVNGQLRLRLQPGSNRGGGSRYSGGLGGRGKLSPKIRDLGSSEPIPTIRTEDIQAFLHNTRVVGEATLDTTPEIKSVGREAVMASPGNKIHAIGLKSIPLGTKYGIYRRGERYVDPETNLVLGTELFEVGQGILVSHDYDTSSVLVESAKREIVVGDKVVNFDTEPVVSNFDLTKPPVNVMGSIIAVSDGVSQIGQFQTIAINKGENSGLAKGNVFKIYQYGGITRDGYRLPDEFAGTVLIIETYPDMSFGFVLEALKPVYVGDMVRSRSKVIEKVVADKNESSCRCDDEETEQ